MQHAVSLPDQQDSAPPAPKRDSDSDATVEDRETADARTARRQHGDPMNGVSALFSAGAVGDNQPPAPQEGLGDGLSDGYAGDPSLLEELRRTVDVCQPHPNAYVRLYQVMDRYSQRLSDPAARRQTRQSTWHDMKRCTPIARGLLGPTNDATPEAHRLSDRTMWEVQDASAVLDGPVVPPDGLEEPDTQLLRELHEAQCVLVDRLRPYWSGGSMLWDSTCAHELHAHLVRNYLQRFGRDLSEQEQFHVRWFMAMQLAALETHLRIFARQVSGIGSASACAPREFEPP